MSFHLSKIEHSPLLGPGGNKFLADLLCITPSKDHLSSLPIPQANANVGKFIGFKNVCECMESIINLDVRSDDVFVCSLPKCGSSWIHLIVWLLTHDLDYDKIQKPRVDFDIPIHLGKFREMSCQRIRVANTETLSDNELLNTLWEKMCDYATPPRILKSHFPVCFLPKQVWTKNARVIYIVRNPKDMAVSLFYFLRNFFYVDVTMDEVVTMITNDLSYYSPHLNHIQEFWKIRHMPNVFFIAYEDLVAEQFACIKRISEFLKCNYSDEQLNTLSEFISFKNMKKNSDVNRERDIAGMEVVHGKKRPDANYT